MTNRNILKQWFSNGKRPTQEQFWEWIESYWHKEEKILQSSIEGLSQSLSDKADGKQMQIHLSDEDAHDLKNKLEKKVDNSVYHEHLSDDNAHGLKDKLAEKVNNEIYYEHLDDEDAHDLKDKLSKKVDESVYQEHLSDENAHGLEDKLGLKADVKFVEDEILRLENELLQQQDVVLTSSMGVKYMLTVDEKGALITTKVE